MGKKNMNQIKKTDFYFDDKIMDYHFLFNSLETINCLALSIGASEICKVTLALANMFRFVIDHSFSSYHRRKWNRRRNRGIC